MSYFTSASRRGNSDVDEFRASTEGQMVDILTAVSHAASGYISAVANIHKFGPLVLDEHELFKRLFKAATDDDWIGGDPP